MPPLHMTIPMPRSARSHRIVSCAVVALLALGGCQGIEPVTAYKQVTEPAKLYLALTLDHRAINLATVQPYDTLRLVATPRNASGEPMSGLSAVTFRSTDTSAVQVSVDGLVRGLKAATGIKVVAELAATNVRHSDTAIVNVTAASDPPLLDNLSIDTVSPSGATVSIVPSLTFAPLFVKAGVILNAFQLLFQSATARPLDSAGNAIFGLAIDYRSLDQTILGIDRSTGRFQITGRLGSVPIVASTTAYGVTRADTGVFTVALPIYNVVQIKAGSSGTLGFGPSEVAIRPGGYAVWQNLTSEPVDVTFDAPDAAAEAGPLCTNVDARLCGAGNIPAFDNSDTVRTGFGGFIVGVRARQFVQPGTYTYHSTQTGATGRIVVAAPPPPAQ
jgi:plastocyanin